MIKAWDADVHVSESEVTFSGKYWDPKLKDRSKTEHCGDRPGRPALLDGRYPLFSGANGSNQQAGFAVDVFLERKDISEESKRKLLADNTARFYGLKM